MTPREIRVEAVDYGSGFVNKKVFTEKGVFSNRKIAISNFIYNCELDRLKYDKEVFDSGFQTHHINWNPEGKYWDYAGVLSAKEHAKKYNRIFLAYPQRNEPLLNELTLDKSINEFKEMLELFEDVPFQIPVSMTRGQWKKIRTYLLSLLSKNQNLVPIISSKHDIREFPLIIKDEIGKSKIIGINSYELRSPIEIINLSYLREINRNVSVGQKTSLFVNFAHPRVLTRISNFPSCFGFSFFAGDIFSERTTFINRMFEKTIKSMFERKPSEYLMYDSNEKKFNKSPQQKGWYGEDITRKVLGGVSVNQGLDGYQVHKWVSQYLLQKDLDKMTSLISSNSDIQEYLKNYSGWGVFIENIKVTLNPNQKKLSSF